jgi:hypothetical protein
MIRIGHSIKMKKGRSRSKRRKERRKKRKEKKRKIIRRLSHY